MHTTKREFTTPSSAVHICFTLKSVDLLRSDPDVSQFGSGCGSLCSGCDGEALSRRDFLIRFESDPTLMSHPYANMCSYELLLFRILVWLMFGRSNATCATGLEASPLTVVP